MKQNKPVNPPQRTTTEAPLRPVAGYWKAWQAKSQKHPTTRTTPARSTAEEIKALKDLYS